ncbi:MAG: hypothetical protein KAS12_04565 [Candidatus Aenigmarchaeota archaeon]|nr:hypothetical protein [Candidatus Aenigmarchaeota archaeon]
MEPVIQIAEGFLESFNVKNTQTYTLFASEIIKTFESLKCFQIPPQTLIYYSAGNNLRLLNHEAPTLSNHETPTLSNHEASVLIHQNGDPHMSDANYLKYIKSFI